VQATIVIRAKNESHDIGDTLAAVFDQSGVSEYDVIIIDSGSTDNTVEIARSFPTRVIEIPADSFTYGRALNIGTRAATGDIVVALSAHSLPASNRWLAELLEPFRDPRVGGVYGRHIPRQNASGPELFGMRLSGVMSEKPRRQTRDMMFSNANGAFRRSLATLHPFDEKLPGAEDLAWADWVLRHNWVLYYQPTAAVYHSHGEPLGRLLRRMVRDQPTIWGLKLGIIGRREQVSPAPAPAYRK